MNRSSLTANTNSGSGGNVELRSVNTLNLRNGSTISATTQSGVGGRLQVNATQRPANTIQVNSGSNITTEATGTGDAGRLNLNAQEITIQGSSPAANSSNTPARNRAGDRPTNSSISATSRSGTGGDIQINADRVTVQDRGSIAASTNTGQAGNLTLNAPDGSVALNNGSLLVQATGTNGQAGGLTVTSDRFTADNGSSASVSSRQGRAGNLAINANAIRLDNSRLTAEAARGSGAEINLRELDQLYLQNGSQISAQATHKANGGNVEIDVANGFVVARIGTNQNNDIIANASEGKGGNIGITTQGILGIQERDQSPSTNDIDASSQFGLNGNIDINQLNTDPSRGLIELPTVPTDATNQIVSACPTTAQEADRLGSFIVSGRGGIPPSPIDLLSEDNTLTEWVTPGEPGNAKAEVPPPTSTPPIVEAQSWEVNAQGKVILVAPSAPASPPVQCK